MKRIRKKSILIMIILVIAIIGLVSCIKNKLQSNRKIALYDSSIENSQVKALEIDEININEMSNRDDNVLIVNKIKNISDFNISDIWIMYNELDSEGNIISESKMFLDMTLLPEDVFKATFKLKKASESINIVSYEYVTEESDVFVNLRDDTINVRKRNNEVVDSLEYEVLLFSDFEKIKDANDGDTYIVKIKNNSSKNLGNITLKIAEINEKDEYIKINHDTSYSTLKPLEEAEITIKASKLADKIRLIGYVYDDVDTKSNLDIDLDSKEAQITKY